MREFLNILLAFLAIVVIWYYVARIGADQIKHKQSISYLEHISNTPYDVYRADQYD